MTTRDPDDDGLLRDVLAAILFVVGMIGAVAVAAHYDGWWGIAALVSVSLIATGLALGLT